MSEMGLIGLKSRYQQGCVPFEEFISLSLSSHNVHLHSLAFVLLPSSKSATAGQVLLTCWLHFKDEDTEQRAQLAKSHINSKK